MAVIKNADKWSEFRGTIAASHANAGRFEFVARCRGECGTAEELKKQKIVEVRGRL